MFYKLAKNNIKKSLKEYIIYFLTIMFGVCLFYIFNSINSQKAMLLISSTQLALLQQLQILMNYVTIFVSVILGFLIIYANRFLMKRRKKELAIYMLLGMEKHNISNIIVLETFITGIFALLSGLLMGVLTSQGLSTVVLAKMFDVKLKEFKFVFSPDAALKSIIYFGIIFVIVMIFNSVTITKFKLIDLLTAAKKNETLKIKKLWISVILFILSVIMIIAAYRIIMGETSDPASKVLQISLLLVLGTFLFFFSLSGFLLKVVQANKRLYYRGLNIFVLRQINTKITTTFISISILSLMLALTISSFSSGCGFAKALSQNFSKNVPYDVTIYHFSMNDKVKYDAIDKHSNYILDKLNQDGMKLVDLISSYQYLHIYNLELTFKQMLKYYIPENKKLAESAKRIWEEKVPVIPLSEYNRNLILQEKEPINLSDNEYAISSTYSLFYNNFTKYINKKEALVINDREFTVYPKLLEYSYHNDANMCAIIVPDKELEGGLLKEHLLNIQFKEDAEQNSKTYINRCESIYGKFHYIGRLKTVQYNDTVALAAVVAFLATYIGIVFLISCSAILALQQLSEASDNISRYQLLQKIGVEAKEINKSVFIQIFLYFMAPLLLALAHSMVILHSAINFIKWFYGNIIASNIIISAAVVIILIYGGYMLATYIVSKSIR